ncbi:LSU ribosomal protein L6p (L9e) [hydrothermal vent metagenome]|uniref:LSU ribosomal protein L6p (L9e) n=1 Tax=hydrothermal vent metagenome TaxID=652676 RepID=A0A3B0V7J8_9ZZZZ
MSRIGKEPIEVPAGASVSLKGNTIEAKGPEGALSIDFNDDVSVAVDGNTITVTRRDDSLKARQLHGLTRTLISNMVNGVVKAFEKKLDIVGVGYKAAVEGGIVNLALGFSHPIHYDIPAGIKVSVDKQTLVTIKGADKQLVGQVAADIRSYRPPEPYKGKGVKYIDEVIRRKAGKAGKGAG